MTVSRTVRWPCLPTRLASRVETMPLGPGTEGVDALLCRWRSGGGVDEAAVRSASFIRCSLCLVGGQVVGSRSLGTLAHPLLPYPGPGESWCHLSHFPKGISSSLGAGAPCRGPHPFLTSPLIAFTRSSGSLPELKLTSPQVRSLL